MAKYMVRNSPEESAIQQLRELFGSTLNLDVIKAVAVSCEYDVNETSNKLLEMTTQSSSDENTQRTYGNSPKAVSNSKKAHDIQRVLNYIEKGYKILIIMRGLPGSGKSHLANQILHSSFSDSGIELNVKNHILSTDEYFCRNPQGLYLYDPRYIEEAHNWNQQRAFQSMSRGYSPVIIDNTNTQMWEMKPYATMATDYGYIIEILEPDNHWCFNEKELSKRNQHGVSKAKISDMLGRYEKNVTPQKLLSAYNLSYRLQKPPQFRLYPPQNIRKSKITNNSQFINNSPQHQNYNALSLNNFMEFNEVPQSRKIGDTIDLMDFNDDSTLIRSTEHLPEKIQPCPQVVSSFDHRNYNAPYSMYQSSTANNRMRNSVDDILMFTNDSNQSSNSNILIPQTNTSMEVIHIDSDDEITPDEKKSAPLDIEKSWGVTEDIFRSWDIVAPLEDVPKTCTPTKAESFKSPIQMNDIGCITEDECFKLLKNPQTDVVYQKIIATVNRDINQNASVSPKKQQIQKKIMYDKSCMTEDIFDDYENHMTELINLFPTIPKSQLSYWYNKCKGDLEWAIEFLLEAKDELDVLYDESKSLEDGQTETDNTESVEVQNQTAGQSTSKLAKTKKFRKNLDQDNELKKAIESKVDIDDKYYSKHVLKVKNYKFNKSKTEQEMVSDTNSSESNLSIENKNEMNNVDDSDVEFGDSESDEPERSESDSFEGTVELNLGDYFVSELERKFGDPSCLIPKGFLPVVQVPQSFARQLYAFYMESVYQQMENQKAVLETLTKEDEEFAKKIQDKEQEVVDAVHGQQAMSFREIMDEQVAQSIYEKETLLWKNLDPDNLAAKLTRQKLFNSFPNIDQNTLLEILHAHDNKYEETVESLLVSTGMTGVVGDVESIREPPIKDDLLNEMKEAKRDNVIEDYTELKEATFYREEANKCLKKRQDLYQKAQVYHQRGMKEVAQFYSMLASQQTQYYERANSLAASGFLDEHSKRLKDFNTLDLHFLYVKEAIPALDLFLDRNINLLRHSDRKQSECLQIITGRGKNSDNKIAKIRPAIQARLRARKIRFQQLNPGLLKIKITKRSFVTSELPV